MPDFGYTTAPATAVSLEGQLWGLNAAPSTSGDLASISCYLREDSADDTHQYQFALYNAAGTTRLGNTATQQIAKTVAAWKTIALTGISVVGGTSYGICAMAGGGGGAVNMHYDTSSGLTTWANAITFPTWPATLTAGNTTRNWGIYATYTESSNLITRTLSDSVSTSDVQGRAAKAFRQMPTDDVSLIDALVRSQQHGRVFSDSASADDAARRAALLFRQVVDSANPADSLVRFAKMFRRIADDAAVADALSVSLTLGGVIIVTRILQDNLNIDDAVKRAVRMYRLESQAVDVRDGTWYSASIVRAVTDTLTVADSIARAMLLTRTVSDPVVAADAAMRFALFSRLAHDDVDAADSLASQVTYFQQLIGFVLQSMRSEPVLMAATQAQPILTSVALAHPILVEMRNI